MVFVGVDPGLTGAIASLSEDGKLITISDYVIDKTGRICSESLLNIMMAIKDYHCDQKVTCCLEKSQSMSSQGVTSMFNYGVTYGIIYSTLKISPKKWKKEFDLNSNKKAGIIKTKEDAVDIAIKLFPSREEQYKRISSRSKKGYVIYDGRADATLIAEYCRRTYK
jgi:crossover junction endodeoxyribonuclease RuvC